MHKHGIVNHISTCDLVVILELHYKDGINEIVEFLR